MLDWLYKLGVVNIIGQNSVATVCTSGAFIESNNSSDYTKILDFSIHPPGTQNKLTSPFSLKKLTDSIW